MSDSVKKKEIKIKTEAYNNLRDINIIRCTEEKAGKIKRARKYMDTQIYDKSETHPENQSHHRT